MTFSDANYKVHLGLVEEEDEEGQRINQER